MAHIDFFLKESVEFESTFGADVGNSYSDQWFVALPIGDERLTVHGTREQLAPFVAAAFYQRDWSDGVLAPLTYAERERIYVLECPDL